MVVFVPKLEVGEREPLSKLCLCFALLMIANYQLQPVRDAVGFLVGTQSTALLVVASAVCAIGVQPMVKQLSRADAIGTVRILRVYYRWCAVGMVVFYVLLPSANTSGVDPATITPASRLCIYAFVVLSNTLNLFAVSLLWNLAADTFAPEQATRLYGVLAAAATAGQGVGSLMAWGALRAGLSVPFLLIVAAGALLGAAHVAPYPTSELKKRPRTRGGSAASARGREGRLAQGKWLCDPYALSIAAYTICYTGTLTLVYLTRQEILSELDHGAGGSAAFSARLNLVAAVLTFAAQLLVTGEVLQRYGIGPPLIALPLINAVGFGAVLLDRATGIAGVEASLCLAVGLLEGYIYPSS